MHRLFGLGRLIDELELSARHLAGPSPVVNIQYATESADPLEIRVYEGTDGSFTLYEDAGDTYDYEAGQHSQIRFDWSEATRQLTIGARVCSFGGMLMNRTFNIVWVSAGHGAGVGVTAAADASIQYDGSRAVVTAP